MGLSVDAHPGKRDYLEKRILKPETFAALSARRLPLRVVNSLLGL